MNEVNKQTTKEKKENSFKVPLNTHIAYGMCFQLSWQIFYHQWQQMYFAYNANSLDSLEWFSHVTKHLNIFFRSNRNIWTMAKLNRIEWWALAFFSSVISKILLYSRIKTKNATDPFDGFPLVKKYWVWVAIWWIFSNDDWNFNQFQSILNIFNQWIHWANLIDGTISA